MNRLSPEGGVNHLDKTMKKGIAIYIPSSMKKIKSSSVPWFDDECYIAMRESQENTRSKESYHQLLQEKQRNHRLKVRNRIRRTRLSERQFWKMAKDLQGSTADKSSRIPPMKQNGGLTTNAHDKCTGFAQAFIDKARLSGGGQFIPRKGRYTRYPEFVFSTEDV